MRSITLLFMSTWLLACGGETFSVGTSNPPGAGGDAPTGVTATSADSTGSTSVVSSSASSGSTSSSSTGQGGGGGGGAGGSANATSSAVTTATSSSSGCLPTSCKDQGKNCGPSDDGCGTPLDCGSCPVNEQCGGGGTPGVCGGCVAKTCAGENVHCGLLDDGCGNVVDCGKYAREQLCDAFPGGTSCSCPQDMGAHQYAWTCDNAPIGASSPPPNLGCVPNPKPNWGWCCQLGTM